MDKRQKWGEGPTQNKGMETGKETSRKFEGGPERRMRK